MCKMSDLYLLFTDSKMDQYLHRCHVTEFVWSVSACMEGTMVFTTISLLLFQNLFLTPVYFSTHRPLFCKSVLQGVVLPEPHSKD